MHKYFNNLGGGIAEPQFYHGDGENKVICTIGAFAWDQPYWFNPEEIDDESRKDLENDLKDLAEVFDEHVGKLMRKHGFHPEEETDSKKRSENKKTVESRKSSTKGYCQPGV